MNEKEIEIGQMIFHYFENKNHDKIEKDLRKTIVDILEKSRYLYNEQKGTVSVDFIESDYNKAITQIIKDINKK